MEFCPDLQDWELILGSDISDNNKSVGIVDEGSEDGAIKADYFALDSVGQRNASPDESNEVGNDSDNPSWADPDSESRFLETSRGKLSYDGMNFPIRNSDGFWSDDSSDGARSLPDREAVEIDNLGGLFMEPASERMDVEREALGEESDGSEDSGGQQLKCVDGGDASITREGEKREKVWWKMPLELLKLCIFRARPVWSISIAAALLGFVMLGRKLYRMKHKTRSIPLRIAMDEKKTSQVMARSARLNAINLVRQIPIIRPSLHASGASQWAALPQI